jgi:hypothetical protein
MRCSLKHADEITAILTDPGVFNWVTDDHGSNKDAVAGLVRNALMNVGIYVLMPADGVVMIFTPVNGIMYEIHTAAVVKNVRDAARAAVCWMIDYTRAEKFITYVSANNRTASLFARRCGMKKEGTLKKAFKKDGTLYDMELFGTTKKDVEEIRKCQR